MSLRRAVRAVQGRFVFGGSIIQGPKRPEIALTFDDGPSAEATADILDILASRGARATFFLLGTSIEKYPDLARRVAAEHEIGCHSYAHERGMTKDVKKFQEDTTRALATFDRILGRRPKYYRFPWGNRGVVVPRDVERQFGMKCVHWSGGGFDERETTENIIQNIRKSMHPGAILLLHDGCAPGSFYPGSREPTVRALPAILDAIDAAGYRVGSVGELLEPERRT